MSLRLLAWAAALLGGVVWVLRWVTGGEPVLHWVGLALLGVACAVGGALLVGKVLALRVVVAVALPLLVLSLVELVRPDDPATFDGVVGLVLLVVAGIGVAGALSGGDREPTDPGRHGRRRAG